MIFVKIFILCNVSPAKITTGFDLVRLGKLHNPTDTIDELHKLGNIL